MLPEASLGLLDEDAITVAGGGPAWRPHTFRSGMHTLAEAGSRDCPQAAASFTETASASGRSLRSEDVAEIVNQSPGALFAALDEAVSAHLLTAAPDGLAFTHEFVRQAAAPPACGTRPPS